MLFLLLIRHPPACAFSMFFYILHRHSPFFLSKFKGSSSISKIRFVSSALGRQVMFQLCFTNLVQHFVISTLCWPSKRNSIHQWVLYADSCKPQQNLPLFVLPKQNTQFVNHLHIDARFPNVLEIFYLLVRF